MDKMSGDSEKNAVIMVKDIFANSFIKHPILKKKKMLVQIFKW